MDIAITANEKVIAYLTRDGAKSPLLARPDGVEDPYWKCGSHPDVVERVWDQLGAALPGKCRVLVCGTPALVQPQSGIILVLALGTQYGMRLPADLAAEALRLGAKTYTRWTYGGDMDTHRDLGDSWIFGAWIGKESEWVRTAFETFGGETRRADAGPRDATRETRA